MHADARSLPGAPGAAAVVQILIRSAPRAVRDGLQALFATAPLCTLSDDAVGTVEIVLAEVLNNIVEHAYAGSDGCIQVRLHHVAPDLWCEITDAGLPMPLGRLPAGDPHRLDPGMELPEGGFGWFLIRTLAQDLTYRRAMGCNLLCFRLQVA